MIPDVTYRDIIEFLESKTQSRDFDIVDSDPHISGAIYPINNDLSFIVNDLQSRLGHHDWSASFAKPQVIYSCNEFTPWVLICLQRWLRQQSCNIENIYLITVHHVGLAQWWKEYIQLTGERTFGIIEWLFPRSRVHQHYFETWKNIKIPIPHKRIKHVFSYYGGSHAYHDTLYPTLKMMPLEEYGVIDLLCDFSISKQDVEGHAHYLSYFADREEKVMGELYDRYVESNTLKLQSVLPYRQSAPQAHADEDIDFKGFQWSIDQNCFACITRETIDTQVFASVTEKTMRAFVHHMAVVPMGYRSVDFLEQHGLWFPHDIIDYSYQHERDFLTRLNGVITSITDLCTKYSLEDLQNYYDQNIDKFQKNAVFCLNYISKA